MKGLLDTHTFLWMDSNSAKLPATVISFLQDPKNTFLLSVASVWEIVIKIQSGKLVLNDSLAQILIHQVTNGIVLLPVTTAHALEVGNLPLFHKDPFDRILAAQSRMEGAALLSGDPVFSQYPVQVIW